MKVSWDIKKLGEVCVIVNGSTPLRSKKEFWNNGDIEWFTIEDIREQGRKITRTKQKVTKAALKETSLRTLPPNSVLLCCTASIGEYAITEIPLATNQQFNGLVVKNKLVLEPLFLFHFCATLKDVLSNLSGKTTIDFIPISRLREIAIPLPPIVEQQRIVAILDQAFEGIAKARANAEQNLKNARALFESHLQSVFTQRGEGYEAKIFNDVLEIKNGKDQKPVEKIGGKFPIYGSAGNVMGWTDSYICDEQTTIIGRKGTINRPIFIETKFWNVDTAFGLAAKQNLNAKFLYFFCLSYDFSLHNRGTTIPSLVKTDLLNIKISVPSLSAQELLVKKFTALHNETKRLEALYQRKIALLDELKKSLLQQAFAGEL